MKFLIHTIYDYDKLNLKEISYEESRKIWEMDVTKVHGDTSYETMRGIANHIEDILNLKESDILLDVGCGNGILDNLLKSKVKRMYGVDFAESKLKEAKQKNPEIKYRRQNFLDEFECGG